MVNTHSETDNKSSDVPDETVGGSPQPPASETGKEPFSWARLLYMILFLLVFGLVEAILWATTIVLFLFTVFTSSRPAGLERFGLTLASYAAQIIRFLTYNKEDAPWPFESWDSER